MSSARPALQTYGLNIDRSEYPDVSYSANYVVYTNLNCPNLNNCIQNNHISIPRNNCNRDTDEIIFPHKTIHLNNSTHRTFFFPAEIAPNTCPNMNGYDLLIADDRKICNRGLCRITRIRELPVVYHEIKQIMKDLSDIEIYLSSYSLLNTRMKENILRIINKYDANYQTQLCQHANLQVDPMNSKRTDFERILSPANTIVAIPIPVDLEGMPFKSYVGQFLKNAYIFLSYFVANLLNSKPGGGVRPINIKDDIQRVNMSILKPIVSIEQEETNFRILGFSLLENMSPKTESPKTESPKTHGVSEQGFALEHTKEDHAPTVSLKQLKKESIKASKESSRQQKLILEKKDADKDLKLMCEFCDAKINYKALILLKNGELISLEEIPKKTEKIESMLHKRVDEKCKNVLIEALEVIQIIDLFLDTHTKSSKSNIILNLCERQYEYIDDLEPTEYKQFYQKFYNIIINDRFRDFDIHDRNPFNIDYMIKLSHKSRQYKIFNNILFLVYLHIFNNITTQTFTLYKDFFNPSHLIKTIRKKMHNFMIIEHQVNINFIDLQQMMQNYNSIYIIDKETNTNKEIIDLTSRIDNEENEIKKLEVLKSPLITKYLEYISKLEEMQKTNNQDEIDKLQGRIQFINNAIITKNNNISEKKDLIKKNEEDINSIKIEIKNKYTNEINEFDNLIDKIFYLVEMIFNFRKIHNETGNFIIYENNIYDILKVKINTPRIEILRILNETQLEEQLKIEFKKHLSNDESYKIFIELLHQKYVIVNSSTYELLKFISICCKMANSQNTNIRVVELYYYHFTVNISKHFLQVCDNELYKSRLELMLYISDKLYLNMFPGNLDDLPDLVTSANPINLLREISEIHSLITSSILFSGESIAEDRVISTQSYINFYTHALQDILKNMEQYIKDNTLSEL